MDGFQVAGIMLGVAELRDRARYARELADELDRRGGGFTSHAAALARQYADRWGQRAQWAEDSLEAPDTQGISLMLLDDRGAMSAENVLIALRWNRDAIASATRWGHAGADGEHFTGANRCPVLSCSETVAALREVTPDGAASPLRHLWQCSQAGAVALLDAAIARLETKAAADPDN
jgi:hypothetical protein